MFSQLPLVVMKKLGLRRVKLPSRGFQIPAWGGDQGHYVAALLLEVATSCQARGGSNVRKSTDSGAVLGLDEDDNDLLDSLNELETTHNV